MNTLNLLRHHKKLMFPAAIILVATGGLIIHGPVSQNLKYHEFADDRTILGLSNFWDVVSNLPFLLVGVSAFLRSTPGWHEQLPGYRTFAVSLILLGFGSGWYHLDPDNQSLVWDRIPMAIGFMAFFTGVISRCFDQETGNKLLLPLVGFGLLSVLYWQASPEIIGADDLRPYILIQFLPFVLMPVMIVLFRNEKILRTQVAMVLGLYLLAKGLETLDTGVFDHFLLSGHTLKHLVAALATWKALDVWHDSGTMKRAG